MSSKLTRTMWSTTASKPYLTRFLRFRQGGPAAYAILLHNDRLRQVRGDIFQNWEETKGLHWIANCKLLHPCEPSKILAVGLNYKSHIGDRETPKNPEVFLKPSSALQNPEDPIVIPPGAQNVHYEGELVLVIGKRTKGVSAEEAKEAIFGVTCGNDVSERDWQIGPERDRQWWRAKGADTFAPLGPVIVQGLDYSNLVLQTRLNGKVVQEQSTKDMLFDPPTLVSFISRYVTLLPGDLVFTGTPGTTQRLSPGDEVEVEIEGVGILRNPVAAAQESTSDNKS